MARKVPSLVDLCVNVAVDNVRYLGDVGETEFYLLERILKHATRDQLRHIEDSTKDRDLSPVTDKLWKLIYTREFGADSTKLVVERMRRNNVTFGWRQLYEAKEQEREEANNRSIDRLKQLYEAEKAKKQSRQVQICSKVPPASKKRSYSGGVVANNIYNTKSNLLKKAKLDFVNSREVKNIAAMNNGVVQRHHSVPSLKRSSSSPGFGASSSKFAKPIQRRF